MLTKFSATFTSLVKPANIRVILFTLMLVLIVLGAGAPGATGV
jgi:hypothetical protein